MANLSAIKDTYSKLKKLTLADNFNVSEPQGIRNSVNLVSETNTTLETAFSEFTFDNVVGHLEDMLIDDDFHKVQNNFLEKYWKEFENSEENKHSYMPIFQEYTEKIEDFIVEYLKKRIINFDMELFAKELEKRKNTLEGEIFEVLLTLSDFSAFKEIVLDYRAMKEGLTIDLGAALSVTSIP